MYYMHGRSFNFVRKDTLQGASTQQNTKHKAGPKQPPAQPGVGSADRGPGAVAVRSASTQQNTKLRAGPKQPPAQAGAGSAGHASQSREPTAVLAGPTTTAMKSSEDQDIEGG
jgi:hypothetical protein